MLEGVTIDQIRTLRAVAETGSFSAAARKLGRVQAAVSQSIDRLESQLGLRLFDRSSRVPRLTQHGQAIVAVTARVEHGLESLEALVENLREGRETSLSIVIDRLFPTESVVTFAADFAKHHPSVDLVLFTDVLSAVTAHVRERRSAWGIALEDANLEGLNRRAIAEVHLIPVVARGHALASLPGPLEVADLSDTVQIVLGEHEQANDRSSTDHGVFSQRRWRVVDLATKHALILAGLGFGHMPEHVVREDLRRGRLVELRLAAWGELAPRRSLVLVWRREAVFGPVAKWAQARLTSLCQRAMGEGGEPGDHTV